MSARQCTPSIAVILFNGWDMGDSRAFLERRAIMPAPLTKPYKGRQGLTLKIHESVDFGYFHDRLREMSGFMIHEPIHVSFIMKNGISCIVFKNRPSTTTDYSSGDTYLRNRIKIYPLSEP